MQRRHAEDWEKLRVQLRTLRVESGTRQADLAKRLGRHQSYVSKYESGERQLDVMELRDICEALGTPLATFIRKWDRGPR